MTKRARFILALFGFNGIICKMSCLECPLQEACDAFSMLDELEDSLAREQVAQEVRQASEDDVSSQDYFDSMLINARTENEAHAAVLLSESCESVTSRVVQIAERGFELVESFALSRKRREATEAFLCPGAKTKHRFLFFGRIAIDCGSNARKHRLGEIS